MSIQTINLSHQSAAQQLVQSLHYSGFAIIDEVPFNLNLIQSCYQSWAKFFENPDEQYIYQQSTGAGWVKREHSEKAKDAKVKDIKEFYHFYLGEQCPNQLLKMTESIYHQSYDLAVKLLSWIQDASPSTITQHFSRPLHEMVCQNNTLLRIIHYPALGDYFIPDAVRAAPHEDINLLTVLPSGTADGLEVLLPDGTWWPVKLKPHQCVINIGDMLQECSQGYYCSTKHRVVNPDEKDVARYSMPLFLHAKDDVVLSERYNAKSYLTERLREIGLIKD